MARTEVMPWVIYDSDPIYGMFIFEVEDWVAKHEIDTVARAAVEDFIRGEVTNGNEEIIEHLEMYDFNWGDALQYMSDEDWAVAGLKVVEAHSSLNAVDHDENLTPEELIGITSGKE